MKLLILCTGNSCRSQMAEGFFRKYAGDRLEVYSAGVEAHGLNPRAVKVMSEIGIDISGQTSNLVTEYLGKGIDKVITVCDSAAQLCPAFPEDTEVTHHSFRDPWRATGTEEEILKEFREVRDQIGAYAQEWVNASLR